MQTDPVGYEDNINLYAYVGNDPINISDPTGERIAVIGSQWDRELLKAAIKDVGNASPALRARLVILATSKFTHKIMFGTPGGPPGTPATTETLTPRYAQNGTGSNTTIVVDTYYRSGVDSLDRDIRTMIAHELFSHSYDSDRGRRNTDINPKTGIPYGEHRAMEVENHYNRSVGRKEQDKYGDRPLRPSTNAAPPPGRCLAVGASGSCGAGLEGIWQ